MQFGPRERFVPGWNVILGGSVGSVRKTEGGSKVWRGKLSQKNLGGKKPSVRESGRRGNFRLVHAEDDHQRLLLPARFKKGHLTRERENNINEKTGKRRAAYGTEKKRRVGAVAEPGHGRRGYNIRTKRGASEGPVFLMQTVPRARWARVRREGRYRVY